MEIPHAVHPTTLRPGSLLGPWRLQGLIAQGAQGVVFRVENSAHPEAGPFTLKLAQQPDDPRFALEMELLSRTSHSSVPRLHDSGHWIGSAGARYPYFVMDFVEGLPLYSWARLQTRRPRELLRVLAQAASAIQAVHAAGGIHRDIKGDHVLVRPEDGRTMLVGFGSCTYRGAPILTRQVEHPGTPQYQSPQSQLHQWKHRRHTGARYESTPADDLYALGVTAYRLATGRYPLIAEDVGTDDDIEDYFAHFPEIVHADVLVQLSPELGRWIRQMLKVEPAERGSMAEVATGLSLASMNEGPEADQPIIAKMQLQPTGPATQIVSSLDELPWKKNLKNMSMWALMAAGGASLLAMRPHEPPAAPTEYARVAGPSKQEASPSGVGETILAQPMISAEYRPYNGITAPVPSDPLPGQRHPPCQGPQIEINGGCWYVVGNVSPPCAETTFEWRKRCYVPVGAPPRPANTGER